MNSVFQFPSSANILHITKNLSLCSTHKKQIFWCNFRELNICSNKSSFIQYYDIIQCTFTCLLYKYIYKKTILKFIFKYHSLLCLMPVQRNLGLPSAAAGFHSLLSATANQQNVYLNLPSINKSKCKTNPKHVVRLQKR